MRKFDITKDKLEFYFDYNQEETNNIKEIFSNIKENKKHLTDCDLRRIVLWKINRILNISDDLIERLEKLAKLKNVNIYDENIKQIIIDLVNSEWIGFPISSAILKFVQPDVFPIIDVRAYRALFWKKIYYNQYSIDIYYNYIEKIYSIRNKLNIPLEKIDEQLYEFDKKYNGRI